MNIPGDPTPSRDPVSSVERLPLIPQLKAQKLLRLGLPFLVAILLGGAFLLWGGVPVIKAQANFVVTKFAPTQVKAGDPLTYTIRVINTNSLDIYVTVTDPIPAGMTITNAGSGSVSSGAIKWTNLSVPAYNQVDVVFIARVTQAGTVVNSDYQAVSGSITEVGPSVTTTVVPNKPANVTILASPNPVAVGSSTVITVSVTDAYGNNVADSTLVSLTSSVGTIDGQPAGTLIQGTTTAGKMVKTLLPGTQVGTAALVATSDGIQGSASLPINPGPPAAMTVTASPDSISVVGAETSTITANIIDQYGNPINPTSVTFATTLGSINNQGSSAVVTSNNGQAIASLKGTVTGVANLTVTAGSVVDSSKSVTLISGPPAQLTLIASPTSIVANGVSTSTLTLTMRDQNDNLVNRSVPVTVTTTAGELTGGGQSYYQTTNTGQVILTLTSITQTTLANVQALAGSLNTDVGVNFVSGPPAKITLEVTPASVYANGTNTTQLKASVRDAYDNLVSTPASVTLAAAEGTIIGGASGSTTNGVFSRNLQTNTALGTIPLTVTVVGLATPTYGTVEFVTGSPHNALITLNPASPITVGTASQMTITVRDSANHPLAGIPISFATTKGSLTPVSSGTTDSSGQVQVTLNSTQSGPATISVTGPGGALIVNGGAISFAAAAPTQATISANPTQLVADNVSTAQITAVLIDQYGNPVPGVVPNFTTTLGTLSGNDATNSAGTTTRILQAGTTLGTATVSLTGVPAVTNATVNFVTGPPASATLSATPATTTVGQNINLAITVKDSIGHPIVGQSLSVTSSLGNVSNCTVTDASGLLTCTLNSTKSGQPVISVAGILATGTTITYNPGDLHHIGIIPFGTQSTPIVVSAGVTTTFSAVGQDVYNNTVPATDFVWETTSFGGTGSIGSATGEFVGALGGLVRIKASAGGKTGVSYVAVGPGTPAKGVVSAAPLSVPANGTSISTLTIAVTDAYGNPVGSGHSISVTSSIGVVEGSGTTNSSGVVNRTLRSTQAGVATISAAGLTLSGDTTVTFTPGSPTKARVVASPISLPANGVAQASLSITLQDQFNNPVGSGFAPVVQTSLGILSGSGSTNSSGTLLRTLTAPTIAGTAVLTVSLGGTPLTVLGDSVTFVVGPISQIKVSPAGAQSVPAGEPRLFTAQAYDADNAPIPSGITYGWELYCNGSGCGQINTIFGQQVTFTGQDAGTGIELIASGDEDGAFYATTIDLTVLPGAPTEATIVASSSVITADGTSPITFTLTNLLDDYGNTAADGAVVTVTVQAEPVPLFNTGIVSGGQAVVVLTSTTTAGTYPISATTYLGEISLTGDTSLTFVPGLPAQAHLISVTPPQIVADGVSTGTVLLQVADTHGNNVVGGLPLLVTSTLGSILPGGAVTDSQGRLTRTLQAGLTLGEAALYVSGFAQTGPGVPFIAGPPAVATVTVITSTLAAGGETSPVIFDVQDAWNHPVADGTTITPTLTPAYGTFSLTDQAVGGRITQTLTSATSVGTATLSVSGLSLTGDTTVTFVPGPAAIARVSASPTSFTVGAGSSALTIAVTDAYDNIVPATAITMTAGLGTFDGGSATVNKTTASGTGLITANLASLVAGTEIFTFTGPAGSLTLHPASDELTFLPAAPVSVAIEPTGPLTLTAGVPVTLTSSSLDPYGNAVDPWHPVTYSWFQTANVGQPGYGTLTAPDSLARAVAFMPETVGSNQVWNSGGVTASNQVAITIVAGPPATATVALTPESVVANGLSTYQVTLTNLADAFGNVIPDGTPLTVTVQAVPPVVKSGLVSGGTLSLSMKSNVDAGNHPLLVEGAAGPLTLSGKTTMTFLPGPAARAEITATPTTLPGDGVSTASLLVKVYDTNLNPVSNGLPITVTTTLGTISGNGTTAAGQVIRTLHAPNNLGTASFTVTGPDGPLFVIGDTVTFIAGGPVYASVTAAPAKVLADGVSTSHLQITVKDGNGFTVDSAETAVLSVGRGTVVPTTTVASAGLFTSTFTAGTEVGLAGLAVVYDGQPLQIVGDSLELIPGTAVSATLTATPTQLIVGSPAGSELTVRLFDSWGRPVADGTVVTVTTTLGDISPSSSSTAGGIVTATLTPGLTMGTASFSVAVAPANSPLPLSGDTVEIVAGPLDHITILPTTAVQVTAGNKVTLNAAGYDYFGNVVSNGPFTWKKWSGSGGGTLSSSGVFTGTKAGSVGVQASLGTIFSPVKPVTIVPGVPFTATVQASPRTIPVGGSTSQLTITAWDAYGNLVANGTSLNVTTNLGTLTGSGTTLDGVLTRTLVSGEFFGAASIFINGWRAGGDQPVFSPGVQFTASPTKLVADGVSQSILTIEMFDNQGQPVSDGTDPIVTATLGTISGSGGTVNGVLTRTLRASLNVGLAEIYVDGLLAAGQVEFTAGPAARAHISASPALILADGVSKTTLQVRVYDAYGHLLPQAGTVTLSTSKGTLSGTAAAVNGVTTRQLTAGTSSGTALLSAAGLAVSGDWKIHFVGDLTDQDFESGTLDSWAVGSVVTRTGTAAVYTATVVSSDVVGNISIVPLSGGKMVRLGATSANNTGHEMSEVWLSQPVYVEPEGVTQITFWYRILSYDVAVGSPSKGYQEWDPFEVYLNGKEVLQDGIIWDHAWQAWHESSPSSPQDMNWKQGVLDLTPYGTSALSTSVRDDGQNYRTLNLANYAGQVVTLEFRLPNRRGAVDNTWVYLDDLDLVHRDQTVTQKIFLPVVVK